MTWTVVFQGSLMDGVDVDLIEWCGLPKLTDEQHDKLWCETNTEDVLELCDAAFIIPTGEADEVPGQSDEFYQVETKDVAKLKDVEVTLAGGSTISIELCELVDGAHIARLIRSETFDWAEWDAEKLTSAISDRIRKKDISSWRSNPYNEYWLPLYTDEPNLSFDQCEQILSGYSARDTSFIDSIFLLFSYDPSKGSCPVMKLL